MIKDIEEKSKTKFSIEVEFSFSFKNRIFCVILFWTKNILSVMINHRVNKGSLRKQAAFLHV